MLARMLLDSVTLRKLTVGFHLGFFFFPPNDSLSSLHGLSTLNEHEVKS